MKARGKGLVIRTRSGYRADQPARTIGLKPKGRNTRLSGIENMPVRAGEPILNSDVKVVRVARLGGDSDPSKLTSAEDFELKRQIRDLFDELAHLENGTVIRL